MLGKSYGEKKAFEEEYDDLILRLKKPFNPSERMKDGHVFIQAVKDRLKSETSGMYSYEYRGTGYDYICIIEIEVEGRLLRRSAYGRTCEEAFLETAKEWSMPID